MRSPIIPAPARAAGVVPAPAAPIAAALLVAILAPALALPAPASAARPGGPGPFGNALVLDGVDDYVWSSPNVSGAAEGTVEMWVRSSVLPASTAIWSAGNGHPGTNGDWARLGTHSTTSGLSWGIYAGAWRWAASGQDDWPAPGWKHLAGTWGPSGVKLYLDGVEVGVNSYTGAMPAYPIELIGATAWGELFAGSIDEVRVWKVQRSGPEIAAAMGDTLDVATYGGAGGDLVAYYRFEALEDLGVGSDGADDVRDLTANGNHADANGEPVLGEGVTAIESTSWGRVKALYSGR